MSTKESFISKLSWERIKEVGELIFLNLKAQAVDLMEYLRVVYRYYWSLPYVKVDSYLVGSYLCNDPFGISKRFLIERGDREIYAYGETPLTSLDKIAKECRLNSSDVVFELGCGRGRTCFWLHQFVGCRVVGVEQIPEFVSRANHVKNKFHVDGVEFRAEDMLQTDLSGATAIYLYGTCLEESLLKKLMNKLEKLPSGTKVITISFPLSDYGTSHAFEVMNRFPVRFNWGATDVYLQIRK